MRFQLQVECFLFAEPTLKLGTVDGNRTRRDFIDSEASPPGELYGKNLAVVLGIEPSSFFVNSEAPTPCLLYHNNLAPQTGIEPMTGRLTAVCSTAELLRNKLGGS